MSSLLYEERGQVGIVTINRPEALNALNNATLAELDALLAEIATSAIRCLIVTGAGEKAFVAGVDIVEMRDFAPDDARESCCASNAVAGRLENFPSPVIAAVNGYALGGGTELALACDIRLASQNAVFALPEVSLGITPGTGGIQRLGRIVGMGKAKEMLFTTSRLNAEQALAAGLVNAVYPLEELMPAALKMAEKIASNAPIAVRAVKKVINASVGMRLEESFMSEQEAFASCFGTNDQRMAMTAFTEKRKPDPFTGS